MNLMTISLEQTVGFVWKASSTHESFGVRADLEVQWA